MPRAKRALKETAQTYAAEPAAKKTKLARPAGKENMDNEGSNVTSNDKTSQKGTDAAHPSASTASTMTCPLKFITMPRPMFDYRLERQDDDEYDEDEEPTDEQVEAISTEAKKMLKKPVSDFPEWTWVTSTKAEKLFCKYDIQAQKRDQDIFGMYIYNDFTGYGLQEVIENQLLAWATEFKKKEPSPYELWAMMDAFAYWWTDRDNMMYWHMLDDGERVRETCRIIGLAILSTLNMLERAELVKKDIVNIPVVLSLFFNIISNMSDAMESGSGERQVWPYQLSAYAKKWGIEIRGVYNTDKTLEDYQEEELTAKEKNDVYEKEGPDKFGFSAKWKKFVTTYGHRGKVGGDAFDITKMTKAHRKKHAFDKKDPLDSMGPPPPEDVDSESDD